jgi:hypothetical protein
MVHPLGAVEWLYRHSRAYEATKSLTYEAYIVEDKEKGRAIGGCRLTRWSC